MKIGNRKQINILFLAKHAEGAKKESFFYKKIFAARAENRCVFARNLFFSPKRRNDLQSLIFNHLYNMTPFMSKKLF
ncbi:MAG: hypothetical protein BWK80_53995 [Desulfobacteraceae bacterium IS3]|nr:MAG: hypothetical protein BWK80_53995 [Desulfobacteraceae bacterium IS3]